MLPEKNLRQRYLRVPAAAAVRGILLLEPFLPPVAVAPQMVRRFLSRLLLLPLLPLMLLRQFIIRLRIMFLIHNAPAAALHVLIRFLQI